MVGATGAGGAEAIVEELGDEVVIRRSAPEGVDEGGADSWLISRGRSVCNSVWSVRVCSFSQLSLNILYGRTTRWMDGIRVHVYERKLNTCRRNMDGNRKHGCHCAEGRQGHIEVIDNWGKD